MTEVFCRYIRKNGKIIYPKNGGFFHFWVEDNEKDPVIEPNLIHVEEQARNLFIFRAVTSAARISFYYTYLKIKRQL